MTYDNVLVAKKLNRWNKYIDNYNLPEWESIPDLGLYMEQLITLLQQYFNYLPEELKEEQFITAATINNYVRKNVMPEPVRKMYFREHIAYLIIILTLKQSLSLAMIQRYVPSNLSKEEIEAVYKRYITQHRTTLDYFVREVRKITAPMLGENSDGNYKIDRTEDIIAANAIIGGFLRLFSEKLILLEDKTADDYEDEE